MKLALAWIWLASCVAACTRPLPEQAHVGPPANVSSSPPASAAAFASASPQALALTSASKPPARKIAAWTDPDVVRELARSCAFEPPKSIGPESPDPLACDLPYEQACVADPCWHRAREDCRKACGATCGTCGKACIASCESCKMSCADDACRTRCAEACGRCRQDCLTARDRCGSASCTGVYTKCRADLVSAWIKNNCDGVCSAFDRCLERCESKSGDDCFETCRATVPGAKTCDANPILCPEMFMAPERRKLDPKWRANKCEDVCAKIRACARAACGKTDAGCFPTDEMFQACWKRTSGASACGNPVQLGEMCGGDED